MRSVLRTALLGLVLVLVAMVSALTAMRFAIHGREVVVPKLVGMAPADARRLAAGSGLLLVIENRFYSSEVAAGRLVSQVPRAGEKVRRGGQVRVAESLGPQRRVIPNLIGLSQRAAEINLRRYGLDLGSVATVPLPDAAAEDVIAQSPSPNAAGVASPIVSLLVAAPPASPEFVMPNLVGRHQAEATRLLRDAGMRLGSVSQVAGSSPGMILRQSPIPGTKVGPGTVVNLEVSK